MSVALVTGGAGFIGTNLAARLLARGESVVVLDDLSRAGSEQNLSWLRASFRRRLQVEVADVRDAAVLARLVPRVDSVFHFAAQTAVTTSVIDPTHDFDVNARGTLRLLEAVRACRKPPALVFTSTNKVYGGLDDVGLHSENGRYEPSDAQLRAQGISEHRALDLHTPYGCSKGTADQYVLEYARQYGLRATVFRMSCIYGPHQCGTEDQGWVAHFAMRSRDGEPIRVFGDGRQVRDLLYVDDLLEALLLARTRIQEITGEPFNIGGGADQAASLLDVIAAIERLQGPCELEFEDWRPSDQRYYVSDTRKFQRFTGWRPRVSVRDGLVRLCAWLARHDERTRGTTAREGGRTEVARAHHERS